MNIHNIYGNASNISSHLQVRGTVRSTKNEEKVAPLRNLCPGAKYPLELVEADLVDEASWLNAVKGNILIAHSMINLNIL